jgi:succinoglycan biosynthesis transport protein ExoP
MSTESAISTLLRRKWIVIGTLLVVVITTAIVSKSLEKVYGAHATMIVSLQSDTPSFDSVQASQAIARSYADIIESPNIAQQVADRVGGGATKQEIADATRFEPVAQTQLLKVHAMDPDPDRAKLIADSYAVVFIQYARRNLESSTEARVTLADAAPRPRSASRPRPTLYVGIAALLGLVLGVALAFLRERLDRRLRTSEDVEAQFELPVLGRVPRRGRSDLAVTAFKESNRVLRTNLNFSTPEGPPRSILVTSGREGEGKTTIVANLAVASAELGLSVIVVEGDLRRPELQQHMMPTLDEPLRPGLSNYLVEAARLEEIIHPTGRPNIDIVPAGPLPPSPSALLDSRRGRNAVSELTSEADVVLIDSPPLNIGADASVMAGWTAGVLLVVDLQSSTDRSVRMALQQLDAVQAPVLGLVLNRDRSAEAKRYHYYTAAPPTDGRRAKAGTPERV